MAGLLNSFETKKPFEVNELAVICEEFYSIYQKALYEYKSLADELK
jgi:hypothetical protein